MSDVMMFGIAKMPYEMAMGDELSRRQFYANTRRLVAALEAARKAAWQPIETATKPDIGANGFGERLLLVVDCGDGTTPSVQRGYWEGTDWYLDCCNNRATACGYRVTHWRPLPAPPAVDQARGKEVP